jgi:hypothetical protein
MMIREIAREKTIDLELLKDESQIKVRIFDEEDTLGNIIKADYNEMLEKKSLCSFCGTEPATFLSIILSFTRVGCFMFTFPSCNEHYRFSHGSVPDTHRGDWTSVFMHKWANDNGLKSPGGWQSQVGYFPENKVSTDSI